MMKPKAVEAEIVYGSLAVQQQADLDPVQFTDLYNAFLAEKSASTIRNYAIDIADFAAFLGAADPIDAMRGLCASGSAQANSRVLAYKAYLKKKKYAASTVNRRIAALRSFTKLARLIGVISWRIEIEGEKARPFKDTTGCGTSGFEAMIATLEREIAAGKDVDTATAARRRWRDRALIFLYYYAGLRRIEPLTARYPDGLRRSKSDGTPELHIIGKKRAGEREWVPIGEVAFRAVEDWIVWRGQDHGPLFPGRNPSKPIHEATINDIVDRIALAAGIDVSPHGIRHSAITEVLERTNGDVRTAQRFARHTNPATTMIYDDNRAHVAARGVRALEGPPSAKKAGGKNQRSGGKSKPQG